MSRATSTGSGVVSAMLLYGYFVVGIFLLIVPWTPVWEQAAYGLVPAVLREPVLSGWVRGVVSGLGAVDLAVGGQVAWEAIRGRGRGPS